VSYIGILAELAVIEAASKKTKKIKTDKNYEALGIK